MQENNVLPHLSPRPAAGNLWPESLGRAYRWGRSVWAGWRLFLTYYPE